MLHFKIKIPGHKECFNEDDQDRIIRFKVDLCRIMLLLNPGTTKQGELCFEYDPATKKFKIDYIAKSFKPDLIMIQITFYRF